MQSISLISRRSFSLAFGVGLCGLPYLLSGCAEVGGVEDPGASGPPLLGPGDRIKITVFGEDQLTTEADVGSDGNVAIPLVGPLKLSGMSMREIETLVAQELTTRKLVLQPRVSAAILRYRQIYILGEVVKPGGYDYQPDLTVLSAIAIAGGFTRRARTGKITVRHQAQPDAAPRLIQVGALLEPGDIIEVPERWF